MVTISGEPQEGSTEFFFNVSLLPSSGQELSSSDRQCLIKHTCCPSGLDSKQIKLRFYFFFFYFFKGGVEGHFAEDSYGKE